MESEVPFNFRSSQSIFGTQLDCNDDTEDDGGYLTGHHFQYEIMDKIVNVAILSLSDAASEGDARENLLILKMSEAQIEADDDVALDRIDAVEQEMQSWVEDQCRLTFSKIAATARSQRTTQTLHRLLHPEIINLQIKTTGREPRVLDCGEKPQWPSGMDLGHPYYNPTRLLREKSFPAYLPTDMMVVKSIGPPKVFHKDGDGTDLMRCKLIKSESDVVREHSTYLRLSARAAALGTIRVPKFRGYVVESLEEADVKTLGLLIENVNIKEEGHISLQHIMDVECPSSEVESTASRSSFPSQERRHKWAQQIENIVQELHQQDITWGDVKPANVVIDVNDDAWVLDFGCGVTRPWKQYGDADTKEGDLEAVKLMCR